LDDRRGISTSLGNCCLVEASGTLSVCADCDGCDDDTVLARSLSVDQVVASCRSLPQPNWVSIVPDHPAPRSAAVLLPIVDLGGCAAIVVTKRASMLQHGGDWVFPGGTVSDGDASHEAAARRETSEELGIDLASITVIGQLSTYGPIVTGHLIESYVGIVESAVPFAPDRGEVAQVATIPLVDFVAASRSHIGPMPEQRRLAVARHPSIDTSARLRFYEVVNGEHLWGLQADLLHELLVHVTDGAHHIPLGDRRSSAPRPRE
jgi:8-oxo-dGTP pyrophosphatase MutT (NUDIX family)